MDVLNFLLTHSTIIPSSGYCGWQWWIHEARRLSFVTDAKMTCYPATLPFHIVRSRVPTSENCILSRNTLSSLRIILSGHAFLSLRIILSGQAFLSLRIIPSGHAFLSLRIILSGHTFLFLRIILSRNTFLGDTRVIRTSLPILVSNVECKHLPVTVHSWIMWKSIRPVWYTRYSHWHRSRFNSQPGSSPR